MLPKKTLDKDLIEKLAEYYKYNFSKEDLDRLNEWECFSHPSLELHDCNQRVLMPGGHKCSCCNNVLGRPCDISCDIQNFCLAAFAWRLGIGGEDFEEAMHSNLYGLKPNELYDLVTMKLSCGDEALPYIGKKLKSSAAKKAAGTKAEVSMEEVNVDGTVEAPVKKTRKTRTTTKHDPKIVEGERFFTFAEAAALRGCTYGNIYMHVKKGKLATVELDGKKYISENVLSAFKMNRKSK